MRSAAIAPVARASRATVAAEPSSAGAAHAPAPSPGPATLLRAPLLWLMPAMALQAVLAALLEPVFVVDVLSVSQALGALALIGGGAWLMRESNRELEAHATPVCVDEPPRALIATGPFRFSRHPMYAGAVAVLLGAALVLGSPVAAGIAALYALYLDRFHARREDLLMHERFGPAWRAYAARVRRWL